MIDIEANQKELKSIACMEDLGKVREDILVAFQEITVGSAYIRLWRTTRTETILISTWNQLKTLSATYVWPKRIAASLSQLFCCGTSPLIALADILSSIMVLNSVV